MSIGSGLPSWKDLVKPYAQNLGIDVADVPLERIMQYAIGKDTSAYSMFIHDFLNFWHKDIYPWQVWLDGTYMAQPFYMEYETRFNKMQGCIDSYKQFMNIKKHMRDEKTGLYYHGYDESRQMYWADPVTGCSPNFWLRAMGWFMVAMVDVLERMDEQLYNEYRGIMAMLKQTIEDVHKFQDEETGMFWQVMDHPGVEGNYLETSGTALFAYAVLKGVRLGYLPKRMAAWAEKAFYGTCDKYLSSQAGQVAVDGLIQVIHIVLQAVIAAVHTAHLGTGLQLNARAIVVDVGFDLVLHLVRQLIAGTGKDLDAVELHRIVGGRDHDAGIGIVLAHQIGHSGRWQNAQTFHIRTHAAQTGGQGCFQHIAGLAGVLADQDARTVAGAAGQHRSSAAADLHCQLTGQVCACNTAHTIGSKIFSHNNTPLSKSVFFKTNSAARCPRAQRPPALSGPDVRRPAALRSGPGASGSESPSASDTAHTGLPA